MSQGVGGVGGSGSVSGVGSLGTCTSVNFVFAKLQMELAASAKDSALGYIKQIEGGSGRTEGSRRHAPEVPRTPESGQRQRRMH